MFRIRDPRCVVRCRVRFTLVGILYKSGKVLGGDDRGILTLKRKTLSEV